PEIELARAIGSRGVPFVRENGEPLVIRAELPGVFLSRRIVRELCHSSRFHVDPIEIVLLGPTGILREHDAAIRPVPGEAGTQRARNLAVADLSRLPRREIHDVELHLAGLVPVEGDTVALPRNGREIERREFAELLERDARLSAGGDGHDVPSPAK